ncbi:MAG: MBL fold metallo-hydrolase [Rhodoferax sp.]|nr:MBL fold metallo-hydrolase [Rhodoferax sp.]MBP9928866.1 MBL fold metallo-hydrolase [Rhodoferax sp.]HQX60983.1 MBL fold metallo-hydrolase [Burkholderiaceae bacterium]HQZ05921.1 MBL fold metallo-hydrolase [Burkholderiaceae bacterium]HRA62902.1 MBL fold metallo-hydrolase [Burkholderiaceae bacterium]
MKLRCWGTRGSIPVSLTAPDVRAKIVRALEGAQGRNLSHPGAIAAYVDSLGFDVAGTFGGHSSCVQIETGGSEHFILDLGTGVRPLGAHMLARYGAAVPQTYHVFLSHLHWDHIMGLPFFTPVYIPGNRIVVHSCHPHAEAALRRQQAEPSFPVRFEQFSAAFEFDTVTPGQAFEVDGTRVIAHAQRHAGDSYGWRFERAGKSAVYSTDSEHRLEDEDERAGFIAFFRDADVVVFDAMYSLADAISVKADWGHSSNIVGVELCQAARVGRLVLFHHEPAYSDTQIANVLQETRRFEQITRDGHVLEVLSAWDGLELTL